MRPRAIAQTAKRKGLDIVSVVDHVCGKNMRAAKTAVEDEGILFLPGIEVTAKRGTHLLCYFKDIETAVMFSEKIYASLSGKVSDHARGDQLILDEKDRIVGEAKKSLSLATPYSVWEIIGLVVVYAGIVVPAHINRAYNGFLLSEDLDIAAYGFSAVEVKKTEEMDYGIIKGTKVIYNSDAHWLFSIMGRENYLDVSEKSVDAVFDYLRT